MTKNFHLFLQFLVLKLHFNRRKRVHGPAKMCQIDLQRVNRSLGVLKSHKKSGSEGERNGENDAQKPDLTNGCKIPEWQSFDNR